MKSHKILKFDKQEVVEQQNKNQVFNFNQFKSHLNISIVHNSFEQLEVEIDGIDASFVNALRRIAIAEVPTMAFHKVFLYQNTSPLPDQLLLHRIGLLVVNVDAKNFKYRKTDQELNPENSLKFILKVACYRKKQYQKMSDQQIDRRNLKPEEYLQNYNVYCNKLQWIPQGNQKDIFKKVELVYNNILITKLGQNQQIYLQIYAEKGIGKQHAKWSPVSTVFYRLMPIINIKSNFNHEKHADMLINCCPVQCFRKNKSNFAEVFAPRKCTTCRQCINLQGIQLAKLEKYYIFTIQSIGVYAAEEIFLRTLQILEDKVKDYLL